MSNRYVVVAGQNAGSVELTERGARAVVAVRDRSVQVDGGRSGSALWAAMIESGVSAQSVSTFTVFEGESTGPAVAYLHAVLEGARVVWLILYRVDRTASAFRAVGRRQRAGDALEACFQAIVKDIELPHKP